MENKTVYCGSGTQKNPELIEIIIYPENIEIQETKRGRKFFVVNLWKRKSPGEYGETHNVTLKQSKDENV